MTIMGVKPLEREILSKLRNRWEGLLAEGQKMSFQKGQTLFYEGHAPYGLFVLKSGKIRFERHSKACPEEHIWQSPEGKAIGLAHAIKKTPFCCTGVAVTSCAVVFISKTQLEGLLDKPVH
jgi:CRP-like cAMP-binding protein